MKKNTASQVVGCQLISKGDGSAVTSGTTTVYVTGDNGTQAVGSVGSGACTHKGNGWWSYTPAQAETNYDHVAFTFVNSSGCNQSVQIYPSFPQTGDNYARLGAPAGASVSADIAAVKVDSAAVKVKTDFLPSAAAGAAGGVFIAGSNAATSANITGNLTGNVSGSVGSVTGLTAADVAAIKAKTDALPSAPADETLIIAATDAIMTRIGAAGAGLTAIPWNASWDAEVQSECADALNAYDSPTKAELDAAVANIPGAVWDEAIAGHSTAGTTGEALGDAGAAGDPWSTALPGAYGAGTAGKIIGDNINATVSSRATPAQVNSECDAAISDAALATAANLALVIAYVDTEIAAIKAKTDQLTFTTANQIDATAITNSDKTGYVLSAAGSAALTEGYAADGAIATLPQLLYMILSLLSEKSIAGTTLTAKKLDGVTTAATFTLGDAILPASITRAT